ncbi:SGNH/GDSL hydrolase family protein [Bacillus haikouensis]|uniref:SGNH/GDSL hydrolase family protein n=1 Tax=Bacillus haikouensis TaxID=1510468 RepID=UPI0015535F4E|nr:SGNH/GDSL hydrolase family protein [Bacillus haikouensis]NQD65567.1 SGNH/GDSL hydrolase family protein [Bacillus haikouensis]
MKKIAFFVLAFVLLLTGCSLEEAAEHVTREVSLWDKENPNENFIPKNLKIVSIGDSLTQGVGDSTKSGGYVPYLENHLEALDGINNAQFHNYGIKGNRTDQLLKRLKEDKVKRSIEESDIVMITIGGNDVMKIFRENLSHLSLEVFQEEKRLYQNRLNDIMKTIKSYNPNAGVVLVGLYNPFNTWFSDVDEVNQIIRNWNSASEQVLSSYDKTLFIKIDDLFIDSGDTLLYEDYFHPNDEGYKLIADRMFTSLSQGETIARLTN